MQLYPRFGLRIHLFKVVEESTVSEMLQTGGVISHGIRRSRDVGGDVTVAMFSLMGAGVGTQVGGSPIRGHSTFPDSGHSRSVVGEVVGGGVDNWEVLGLDGHLTKESTVLQVAVGDGPGRVVGGDNVGLDVRRKRQSPQVGLESVVKEDTAHPSLGSISRSEVGRSLGDDLCKVSGSVTQTGSQVGKGIHMSPEGAVDPDPVTFGLGECQLQGAEETCRTRDCHGDKLKFPKDPLPFLGADAVGTSQPLEDVRQGLLPVSGELQGLPQRVNDPAQDKLPGGPAAVALQ